MGDHTKPWENKNVDFGVAKESEQVLIQDGVTPSCGVKEGCIKVTICQKHGDAGCKDGEGEEKEDCCNKNGPHK